MLAYTYVGRGDLRLLEKPEPVLLEDRDALVSPTVDFLRLEEVVILTHGPEEEEEEAE